ncbi:hypothetical protein LXA43DRAFT_362598 [Ganoderma leucocontextum]|nr:hypothetical protein LXA43DRAFT_362598 [Ganoderma leucocontextum]
MSSSPLPPVNSVPPIDNTFGAILIATFVALTLYGLVAHQCYRYFQLYPKDSVWIKSLVLFTLVFETFHIVLGTHTCYYYLVTSYSHTDALRSSVWSLGLLSVTTALVGIPSQIFFARRIFRLGGLRYRVLVVFAFILFAAELGFLCAGTSAALVFKPFSKFQHYTWLISAGAGTGVVADGLITAVLVNLLRSKHIGVKRMDRILNTLILYTINTGLLTGTLDLLSFLFALIYPNNLIYAAFGIVATKMYANSLLAALNTRNSLRTGPNCVLTISAAESNTLFAPQRETTACETQELGGVTSQKVEGSENSQAFLTLELVGIAV